MNDGYETPGGEDLILLSIEQVRLERDQLLSQTHPIQDLILDSPRATAELLATLEQLDIVEADLLTMVTPDDMEETHDLP